jgi:two-component system cell cycle response regulator
VSRRHARVVQAGGEVRIEDLDSANGTFVNGQSIRSAALHDGDKIQMGSTTILKVSYANELEENLQQKMQDAAIYDGLTKGCTKRHFLHRLEMEVAYAKRHGAPLSLLLLDVDYFKLVNDGLGHLAGNHVLATLAQIVRSTIRTEDLFARYGGEEFAVLCRGTRIDNALAIAERLRA